MTELLPGWPAWTSGLAPVALNVSQHLQAGVLVHLHAEEDEHQRADGSQHVGHGAAHDDGVVDAVGRQEGQKGCSRWAKWRPADQSSSPGARTGTFS